MPRVDAFLKLGLEQGCSDVHLAVGAPPLLRLHGELTPIAFRDLGEAELEHYAWEILTPLQKTRFEQGEDLDFAYVAEYAGRFRVNLYRKFSGVGMVFRLIPSLIPSLSDLGLPPVVQGLATHARGLILVTGSTGTGKSTTLAALIDQLNQTQQQNIITLEDPIEFLHPSKRSQVIQREVGTHVQSFTRGLRAALRQNPDTILVGEMRDPETILMAMHAAETGHLVLGTLHTTSATKSIDRWLDALSAESREQGKLFLAQHLYAIVTQILVKRLASTRRPGQANRRTRKAIVEVLIKTPAIAHLISSDKVHQIPNQIHTGRALGMQLMDQALLEAVQGKEIDPDDAYLYANDKRPFRRFITDPALLAVTEGT